jgi:type III restriction enzyme
LNIGDDRNNARRFIDEVICPHVTFEVSATPERVIPNEDLVDGKAGFVNVQFDDVVAEGLIKQETVINAGVDNYTDFTGSADDVVLTAALAKRHSVLQTYQQAGIAVNPLVLIQLPNSNKSMNALDNQMKVVVEAFLAEKNITYENGKLAVWLSEEKSETLQDIERNDNAVEVLIFKTAIATGWDCPRAQILVMLRPMESVTFEIQTVGRILRMPEAMHYNDLDLNRAFIYTNIPKPVVKEDRESLEFFKVKTARLKKEIQNVMLPSVFLHRTDYGDLTQKFEDVLVKELHHRFDITEEFTEENEDDAVWQRDVLQKVQAKKLLEWDSEKLKQPILSNVVVQNIDKMAEAMQNADIEKVMLDVSNQNIQRMFDLLTFNWSSPYAPSRSYQKIKQGIYRWFRQLGYDYRRYAEIQRMVTCSATNQEFFMECINAAKEQYKSIRQEEMKEKRQQTEFVFSLPVSDTFGENYEHFQTEKYAYGRCYLRKDRPDTERGFEEKIDASDKVEWWYKNGEKTQTYFAIAYETT